MSTGAKCDIEPFKFTRWNSKHIVNQPISLVEVSGRSRHFQEENLLIIITTLSR